MKNSIFFIILALLTVIALVSFSTAKNRLSLFKQSAVKTSPSPTPTPVKEVGGALGRTDSGFGAAIQPTPTTVPGMSLGQVAGTNTTKGGIPLATIVTPKPTAIPVITTAPSTTTNGRPTVLFEEGGFRPQSFSVKSGTMMVFKNITNRQMKVRGDDTALQTYPTFSQQWTVGTNGFFEFQFNQTGTYSYRDIATGNTGSIVVTN